RLDTLKSELLEVAQKEEKQIEKEYKAVKKKLQQEEEEDDEEEEEDESKAKRKKIIIAVVALVLGYAVLFPSEDKPKTPPFKHLPAHIVFPVPFDKADTNKSDIEYQKGVELFSKGGYVNIVKASILFRSSYENNLDNLKALNLLVRSFAEQVKYSKQ